MNTQTVVGGDHFHHLIVWSGRDAAGAEYDPVRRRLQDFLWQRAKRRFPMPQMHVVTEGDSMSRRFTALLAPSHADPLDHQLANF